VSTCGIPGDCQYGCQRELCKRARLKREQGESHGETHLEALKVKAAPRAHPRTYCLHANTHWGESEIEVGEHTHSAESRLDQARKQEAKPKDSEAEIGLSLLTEVPSRSTASAPAETLAMRRARLTDPRMQNLQRQALASQIGQVQGNRRLTSVIRSLEVNKARSDQKGDTPASDVETQDGLIAATLGSTGQPMDHATRNALEPYFDQEIGEIRVHADTQAELAAQSVQARAFTVGRDIVFNSGEYQPDTAKGRVLIAHELTHLAQQQTGGMTESHASLSTTTPGSQAEREAEAVARTVSSASLMGRREGNHRSGEVPRPQISSTPSQISRMLLGTLNPDYDNMEVHTQSVEQWRQFLIEADAWWRAIKLNVFMARAVGHAAFDQDLDRADREAQAQMLDAMARPSQTHCVDLMIALLSTSEIDLREIGDASPVTGYLLPLFVQQFYGPTVESVASRAGTAGEYARWRIDPSRVADFLSEAEAVYHDAFQTQPGPYQPMYEDLASIGVAGESAGARPTVILQAQAFAGAQAAVGAAHGAALEGRENAHTIAERYSLLIRMHAGVLSGIVQEQDRIYEMNRAITDAVIGSIFAAGGPLVGKLELLERFIGRGAQNETAREAVGGVVEGLLKDTTDAAASSLYGLSGDVLRARFRDSFDVTLQEYLNRIRSRPRGEGEAPIPDIVGEVNDALRGAFDYVVS